MKNPFKFNIVTFHDGTYGVRRGFFSHTYLGIHNEYTWTVDYNINLYCKGTLEEAKATLQRHNNNTINSKFI